ncbi:MAG: nucleotidyltransferase family protein [Candidatus Omnitrophota bacterium]|nr:nucleotidyltransferase family protein [Candidatus Omnitrophota bacterium]
MILDELAKRAQDEGISALLYYGIKGTSLLGSLPSKFILELARHYYNNASFNLFAQKKLNEVLAAFETAGIDAIVLKGLALMDTVYPNIAIRPITDIDLLIKESDFPYAKNKLNELGYACEEYCQEDFYNGEMAIDIHSSILNSVRVKSRYKTCKIDNAELWRDSDFITLNGRKIRVLSPEDQLISLCLHLFYHHGLKRLIWFVDIYALLNTHENVFDWARFLDKCCRFKIKSPVYYCLLAAEIKLKIKVPQEVLEKLKPPSESILTRKILDLAMHKDISEKVRFYFILLSLEKFKDKLLYLFEIILPRPNVLRAVYLPGYSLPRLYLLHFKAIFVESSKAMSSLLFPI